MTREEYIKRINSIILLQDKEYSITINKLWNNYLAGKTLLFKIDMSVLKLTEPAIFFLILLKICKAVTFFPDKEVSKELKKCGVTSKITR